MPKLSEIIIEVKQIERKIALKQSELKELQTRLSDLTGQDVSFDVTSPEVEEDTELEVYQKKTKRAKKVVEPEETKITGERSSYYDNQ